MFKPTLLALSLASAVVAGPAAASTDSDVRYHVTVLSRNSVVFEGEGRVDSGRSLELRQFVLARDNAGQGQSFVDSGFKVVVQQARHEADRVSSRLTLDVAGAAHDAATTVELKLGEEASAELAGYTVKVVASAVLPKESPLVPEDFAYLAPSLNLASLTLPNVSFDRQAYQLANAVLARPEGQNFAAVLVAPQSLAQTLGGAPLLYAAQR